MSHLAHELHMPLTPPVMRRPGTERKRGHREGPAEKGQGRGLEAPGSLWGPRPLAAG